LTRRIERSKHLTSLLINSQDRAAIDATVLHIRQGTIRILQ
jgi:hypothetical protein